MGIIGDAISAAEVEGKILKLKTCKYDLSDDNVSIAVYNKAIDRMITDVQGFLGTSGSRKVVTMLNNYPEPYQGSDQILATAREYIQKEINYLKGQTGSGGGIR